MTALRATRFSCSFLTDLSVIDSLVFDSPREPLLGGRAGFKVAVRMLLYGVRNKRTILHERTEDLGVAWASEKYKGPTFVFALNARGRDYAVDVGLEETSAED